MRHQETSSYGHDTVFAYLNDTPWRVALSFALALCVMCHLVCSSSVVMAASIQVGTSNKEGVPATKTPAASSQASDEIEVKDGLVSVPGEDTQNDDPVSQAIKKPASVTALEQVKLSKEEQIDVALKYWQLMFKGDINALYALGELYEKKGHLAMAYAYYQKGAKLAQDGLSEDAASRLESQLTPQQVQLANQEVVKFAQLIRAQQETQMVYVTYRQEIGKPSTSQARIQALSQSIEVANQKQKQAFASYRPYDGAFMAQQIKSAAMLGHAEANFVLAEFYRLGILVTQSDTEMAKYAKKGAFAGHPSAMLLHAIALMKGIGAEPNPVDVLAWLYLASNRGCAEAKLQLPAVEKMVPNELLSTAKSRMAQLQRTVPRYNAVLDR